MENASKALIIAGAILLSILLISLGIMVYTQAKGTVNDADLSSEEAQTFNTKFTQYGGTQTGTKLNALIDAAIANNGQNSLHQVNINGSAPSGVQRYTKTESKSVGFEYDGNGYVSNITIQ